MTEYILAAISLVLAALVSYYTYRCFRRKRRKLGLICTPVSLLLVLFSVFATGLVLEQSTYQRLTREHTLGTVEFTQVADKEFQVLLSRPHSPPMELVMFGDQWQIDARIFKWKGLAAKLGLQPMYNLERVSGRYEDIQDEKTASRSVYEIRSSELSVWNLLIEYREHLPWFDAYYGNATYIPMRHKAKFMIMLTSTGLIARPRNWEASQSLNVWKQG